MRKSENLGPFVMLVAGICVVGTCAAASNEAHAQVIAAQVDIANRMGSPGVTILNQTSGADLLVGDGNEGDFDLGFQKTANPAFGLPFLQADGVVIANMNELPPSNNRGGVTVPGELTGSPPGNSSNGGMWVASHTAVGEGTEENYDFSFASFRYEDGWIAGHVASSGNSFLGSGNLPAGSSVSAITAGDFGGSYVGERLLSLSGRNSSTDGMLFAVEASNGDNHVSAGVRDDGTGWHIHTRDENFNTFTDVENAPFSFAYMSYDTPGLIGGRIDDDGSILNTTDFGDGLFSSTRTGAGTYELSLDDGLGGTFDDSDGILVLTVSKLFPSGADDNEIAWDYDPGANGGNGAFVVSSMDLSGFSLQDSEFVFAFIPYQNSLFAIPEPSAMVLSALALLALLGLRRRRRRS